MRFQLPLVLCGANRDLLKFFIGRFYSPIKTIQNTEIMNHKSEFPEQIIKITTCGNLYKKWKIERKFWRIPNDNLTFQVKFIDTQKATPNSKALVALALHGAPGTYADFSILSSYLHKQGIRVIAPSLPDFKEYKPGVFRHSADERAELIKDFLKAINVPQIDLLICHSSSVYPGLILCLEQKDIIIKSIAMLNAGAHSIYMRATRPYLLMSSMVKASEFWIFLKLIEYFGPFILKKIAKSPVRVDNYLDPLLSATVMTYADIPKVKARLLELSSRKFSFLFAFSEDDKLIDKKLSYQMCTLIGAQPSDIHYINKDGDIIMKGSHDRLKIMSFENGSHYVFWKYPQIINEAIAEFLTKQSTN